MTDHERLREIHHVTSTVRDATDAITRIRALLADDAYEGSRFVSPAPGVTLGAITPEARELIDGILTAWDAHVPNVRHNNKRVGVATPDRETLYGFVYWLCRWSGLVRPARALVAEPLPSVEWRDGERASDAWVDDWRLAVWQLPGQSLWTVHVSTIRGPSVDAWRLPDRDSAKRRALALCAALRGVT